MKSFLTYPGSPLEHGWRHFLGARIQTFKYARRPMDRSGVRIEGNFRSLNADDIPLIAVAQNERRLMSAFLSTIGALELRDFCGWTMRLLTVLRIFSLPNPT